MTRNNWVLLFDLALAVLSNRFVCRNSGLGGPSLGGFARCDFSRERDYARRLCRSDAVPRPPGAVADHDLESDR